MLLVFVLALTMPFSLANAAAYCGDGCGCCTVPNLAQISWEHAVNSQELLTKALANEKSQMIEADVVLGTLKSVKEAESVDSASAKVPIMAHPPSTESDLLFEDFVKKVSEHNKANKEKVKGIKLDFKTIEAVQKSLPLVNVKDVMAEVWINSDIIAGPGKSVDVVDAKAFFKAVADQDMKKATLSLGWTTDLKADAPSYTKEHVSAMITAIQDNKVPTAHPITFAVRAVIAAESIETLESLIKQMEEKKYKVTFSLWSAETDKPDVKKVQDFITKFTVNKVYVDVPEELKNKLKLEAATPSGASNLVQYGLLNMVAFIFAFFFRSSLF